ncbi:MAG: ankyrin repeat domain-containing protein, partial [Proteobacteria bacterium]|nr:ankyrin repeat domain-containing protein [Pseudomonadota bacterium]
MKTNQLTTAWAMFFVAFTMCACQKQMQSPAAPPPQQENVLPAEAGADSANQAAGGKPLPEAATQENVHGTEPGADSANESMPQANADAPKETITLKDWHQYHLEHCWPYQEDTQCNEAEWERFHDYIMNHSLNYDSIRALFLRYGDEIERTAQWIKERENSCISRLDPGGGCDKGCCIEETIWNDLINEMTIIRDSYNSNHPKEQYALWKLVTEDKAESSDEDKPKKSNEQKREELRALIEAGADVWDRNQNGIRPVFLIKDKQILRELIQSEDFSIWRTDNHNRTLLHVISERGDIDADFIQLFINKHADINVRDDQGNTPLGLYVLNNEPDESIIQAFIDAGADLYAANKKGRIPLYKLPPDMVLKLIEKGNIKPDAKDALGKTLLHVFISHEELVKYLIDAGLDINAKDNDGNTVLHNKHISLATVQQLVKLGANINAQNKTGETPLMIICDDNAQNESISDLECTQKLMELGADVKLRDANGDDFVMRRIIENMFSTYYPENDDIIEYLESANDYRFTNVSKHFSKLFFQKLIYIATEDDRINDACYDSDNSPSYMVNMIPELIKAGLDIHQKTEDGNTYLFYKFYEFDSPLVYESLIKLGLNVNAKNKRSETPLHQHLGLETMNVLINAGADVNAKDELGRTPLFYNIQTRQPYMCDYFKVLNKDVADFLLASGANINEKDKNGRTVLYYIDNDFNTGDPAVTLKYLVEHGIDLNAVDNEGKTALFSLPTQYGDIDITKENNACSIYEAFMKEGGKLDAKDKYGRNVLFYKPQLVNCFKGIANKNPSIQLDIKALINEPDNDGIKLLTYMHKGEFIKSFKSYFSELYHESPGLYSDPEDDEFKEFYLEVMQLLVESGADAGCGLGGTVSEDMCVCGQIRYSQAEALQWTCLGDLLRCLQYDGCSLFGKKYPAASDRCDADKKAVNGYPCSERWECDAESCDCHQITIHSGDVCVPGGVLAPNKGIYETQDDYNNRTSKCGGKPIADTFIAKEEDVLCKDDNWLCFTEENNDSSFCQFTIKNLYYDLQKQSWVCESQSEKDKDALYCAGQPFPGDESDKSSYDCDIFDNKWVCEKESCSCRTSMRIDDAAYSKIGNQKVCDLSGIIPNYKSIQKNHMLYSVCKDASNYVTLNIFDEGKEIVCKKEKNCRCPNGYVKYFIENEYESEYESEYNMYRCVNKDTACNNGEIYDPSKQTCVCPKDSVYNSQLGRCEFFKCQNDKCKDDFSKTCLTDIHACIEECPKGYIYDIIMDKCRKYKEKCKNKLDDLEDLALISCDFAARHGYDTGYGNNATWDQTFEWFDEECAEDNDEDSGELMENSHYAANDNAPAPSTDKSTNHGDIPKGMRLGPCYDKVYYGYGIHFEGGGDGGYYRIGTTVRCVSVNGCSCGESTCQKYGQCIDGQCHYDDFYLDLMCYAKKSNVGDWYDDDEDDDDGDISTFPITADNDGNCACNHTILNPGFNYKNEYLCSQYGWLCEKDTGCRCGDIQCEHGSVCIAPGQCSQPVIP